MAHRLDASVRWHDGKPPCAASRASSAPCRASAARVVDEQHAVRDGRSRAAGRSASRPSIPPHGPCPSRRASVTRHAVGRVDLGILLGDRQAALVVGRHLVAEADRISGLMKTLRVADRLAVLVLRLLQVDDEHARSARRPGSRRGRCRGASYIVSNMSATSARTSSSTVSTGLRDRRAGRGSGTSRMGRTAMARELGKRAELRQATGPPRAQRLGQRAFVEIVELAADRQAVRELGDADREALDPLGDDNARWSGPRAWRSSPARPRRSRRPRPGATSWSMREILGPHAFERRQPAAEHVEAARETAASGRAPRDRRPPRPRTARAASRRGSAQIAQGSVVSTLPQIEQVASRSSTALERARAAAPAPSRAS